MLTFVKTPKGDYRADTKAGPLTCRKRPDGYFDLYAGRKKLNEKRDRLGALKTLAESFVAETPAGPATQDDECLAHLLDLPASEPNDDYEVEVAERETALDRLDAENPPEPTATVADVRAMQAAVNEHCGPYTITVSPTADPAAVERVMQYATPLIGNAAMKRRDAQTDGAEDTADRAAKEGEGGVTFRIKRDETGTDYYAHVSRPGRPGEETDSYMTPEAVRTEVLTTWPKAVEITPTMEFTVDTDYGPMKVSAKSQAEAEATAKRDGYRIIPAGSDAFDPAEDAAVERLKTVHPKARDMVDRATVLLPGETERVVIEMDYGPGEEEGTELSRTPIPMPGAEQKTKAPTVIVEGVVLPVDEHPARQVRQ